MVDEGVDSLGTEYQTRGSPDRPGRVGGYPYSYYSFRTGKLSSGDSGTMGLLHHDNG